MTVFRCALSLSLGHHHTWTGCTFSFTFSWELYPSVMIGSLAQCWREKSEQETTSLSSVTARNFSSDSYDLLIINITETDEGLYYCGTDELRVDNKENITSKHVYTYGNISTRIHFNSKPHHQETPQDCGVCWMLLFSLCPALAVLSSLLSSLLVYHLCKKEEPQTDQQTPRTTQNQDEDVCYAAVEYRQVSQKPKWKKNQSSDFCTYSAINTSSMETL
ncbi:uncharacterized protein LOC134864380 isoform X2 [Eleginops maclovinus]|uniref:uncharacterized protein LOC134864380 isoform X2 n=1 Tax=Eleginops maclovinus TaxID=56733 RepID=UPI003080B027